MNRALTALIVLVLLLPAASWAQTRYISDELALDMRSGPGNQFRIQQMVPAGTQVQVLDNDSGWSLVRLGEGREGWVLTRLLADQPSARSQLNSAQRNLSQVRDENQELRASLEEALARVDELESGLTDTSSERDRLEQQLEQASRGLQLHSENEELKKEVIDLRREIQDLSHETERLRDRNDQRWFIVGSGVLAFGILMGLILPRIRWRKRNSWGSGSL
ncbi:MAG: TIGR04211 family SH3 domain-containing protein [Ectothiorhodospiraceae bacterium]|nr:TIGR04211 family SH3 domain-containing protein [Ectothiorhodospiraceae bacterium]